MKKLYLILVFFVFCSISSFGENDTHEEVEFLLFLPNSSNHFVNEEQSFIQLDNLARYLSNKNLTPGQIIVYGYAAFSPIDIEPIDLSRERAFFVINELQKRGISKELFSDPVGHGSVYLWGNNTDENDRKFNRRVRILLGGESPIQITQEIINDETETAIPGTVQEALVTQKDTPEKSSFKFPWRLLLLLLILLLLLLTLKKRSKKTIHKNVTENTQPQITKTDTAPKPAPSPAHTPKPVPPPVAAPAPITAPVSETKPEAAAPSSAMKTTTVNLDEEIRFCAYEYFLRRNGEGDYQDQDWYDALREVSARYTPSGYSVFFNNGYWWASR